MKVLLHSKVFYPSIGGLERVSDILATELLKRGIDVSVLTETAAARAQVGEHFSYPVHRQLSLAEKDRLVRDMDIVHANGYSLQLLPHCLWHRKPLIWTHAGYQATCMVGQGIHVPSRQSCNHRWSRCFRLAAAERGTRFAMQRLANWAMRRGLLHLAGCNVAITDWVAQRIRAPHATVIWNPVDIGVFLRLGESRSIGRFTFVGRLVSEKGVDVLIHALAQCHTKGRRYGLDVFGDGPERPALERLTSELGLSESVAFRGMVSGSQLVDAVAGSWIMVVPSVYEEPMGIVAVEAMAAGTPLIVSQAGGLAEIADGCALTFANGDGNQLARQMIRLADDPALHQQLSERGPIRARLFDAGRIVGIYIELYQRLCKRYI